LNKRLGGCQSWSGCGGEENNPCQEPNPKRPTQSQSLY